METPPPLPSEDPPKSPSPPLPPPSIQASNHDHERLDFETDAGGKLSSIDGCPPAKRQRIDSQTEGEGFGEDEGPDTLLGSGLAAELLEEGEIFDSESILSRNGSIKSNSQCQDRDGSQATDSPLVVGDDSNSIIDFEDSSGKKCAMEHSPGMFDEEDNQTLNTAELQNDDEQQEQIEDMINTTIQEESKECSLKPAIPSHGQEEFEVIDDLESDGEGGGDQNCGDHDSDDESDDIVYDEDEIDALLDEEMDKNAPKEKDSEKTHVAGAVLEQKEKVLLVDRCTDPFDILPENWVMVTHNSGMPVYLHKKTRVCTLSKPYFLGPSSARKHDIPISAIPCLQYRRALEKEAGGSADPGSQSEDSNIMMEEQQQNTISSENGTTTDSVSQTEASQSTDPSKAGLPKLGVRVETAKDHEKQNSLNYMEVREYCERLFQFKTITVKRFKTWKDRRKHTSLLKKVARPSLPSSTKLIRCAIPADKDGKGAKRKEFVLNPAGKSDICILHEYVQQALRVQPRYIFEELQNSQTPFGATVLIGGEKYGSGFSSSKKGAKLEAAKQTLAILIPEMNKLKEEERDDSSTSDLSLFDTIKIEDPRVTELCIKAGQPGPFQVLCECLKRNYGVGDTQVQMEMKALKHQKSEFIMKVGKHEACVVCKNKREGKQQAAQAILQKMHPHIHTWGSLLRLYDRSTITQQNKETESVIDLQIKSKSMPNKAILNKLKEEMRKLHSKHNEVKSNIKGRIHLPGAVGFASTDLGSVDL